MSFRVAREAKEEFRSRQRERREQGGLRRRKQQRRDDDDGDKKKSKGESEDDEEHAEDDDESEDDSSSTSRQIRITTLTRSSQTSTLSSATLTSSAARMTLTTVSRSTTATVPSTTVATSSILTTPLILSSTQAVASSSVKQLSTITTSPQAITSQSSVSSFTTSSQPSSTTSSAASTNTASAETAGSGISSTLPSSVNNSSNPTVIIFSVAFAIAGLALFAAMFFCIRRRVNKENTTRREEGEARAYGTRSVWDTASASDSRTASMAQYIPPITMGRSQYGERNAPGNDAVDRRERLARVRTDILGERDLQFGNGLGSGLFNGGGSGRHAGPGRFQKLDDGPSNERLSEDVDVTIAMWQPPPPVAKRDSRVDSVDSVPRWQDPISWARDQARRNNTRPNDA